MTAIILTGMVVALGLLMAVLGVPLWPTRTKAHTLWAAVDRDGTYCLYDARPRRLACIWHCGGTGYTAVESQELLKHLPKLTWEDEPVMITIDW